MFHYSATLLLFYLCTQVQVLVAQDKFHVWPNCATTVKNVTECIEIDHALKQLPTLTADTTIMLHPGEHVLHETSLVSGINNLSLIGEQETDGTSVVITCDYGNGLAFFNVSGLQIQGITIHNCGLSGPNLKMAVEKLEEHVNSFIFIPSTINVALFFGQCEDLFLERVTVRDTTGLGLLGVNIFGNSFFQELRFINNTRHPQACENYGPFYEFVQNQTKYDQIGGGAYILFLDQLSPKGNDTNMTHHQLVINDSDFYFNTACSFVTLTEINFQYYYEYLNQTDYLYLVGGGGGLSVFMAQLTYYVEVNIHTSTFMYNDARYGGGVYVAFFLGVQQSGINLSNCTFAKNGLASDSVSYSNGGAGMAVFTDILRPMDSFTSNELNSQTRDIFVKLNDTHFINNSASVQGGGLLTYSQHYTRTIPSPIGTSNVYTKFTIKNCVFSGNTAIYGSAAFLKQSVQHGFDGGVGVWMTDVRFIENGVNDHIDPTVHGHIDSHTTGSDASYSSSFDIHGIQLYVSGNIDISRNNVTGCNIQSSTVHITAYTSVHITENQGHFGGGVRLQGSFPAIFMNRDTVLLLSRNSATKLGGAVYFAPSANTDELLQSLNNSDCFLFPSVDLCPAMLYSICDTLLPEANITVEFRDNDAPLGSSIYGSTLESCPWANRLLEIRNEVDPTTSLFEFINTTFHTGIIFNNTPKNTPTEAMLLSTPPVELKIAAPKMEKLYRVFPGEVINLNSTILDSFGHRIPSVLTASVSNDSINATSRLGASGFWFVDQESGNTPLTVTSPQNTTIAVTFLTSDASASTELTFEIRPCPLGFIFSNQNSSCVCDERLLPVRCDMSSFKLIVPKSFWVGPVSDVETATNDDLVVYGCERKYCSGDTQFQPPNFDSQCIERLNRKGFLCGACKSNYSIAFGAQVRCTKCSNYYIFTVIPVIVYGVVLFFVISFFGITIDKGWMNMVLFYSNILYSHNYIRTKYLFQQILAIPLTLLSLRMEVDMCFYNGMTSLAVAGLLFILPAYLYLLMIIFALLVRHSLWLSKRCSPVSTFVTLAIMSYVSILDNCIVILSADRPRTLGNRAFLRWRIDPTQAYFEGWHAVLGILAVILLIVYIIPFPLVLLFPKVAYRCFGRFKPFLDALYAPFELKYRFWLGLRLIIRAAIFIPPNFVITVNSLTITGIILVCFAHIQLVVKPFKNNWQNILDSTLIVDSVVLAIGALYFDGDPVLSGTAGKIVNNTGYVILVGGAYMIFIYILIIHLYMKYPTIEKPFTWCKQKLPCFGKRPPVSPVSGVTAPWYCDGIEASYEGSTALNGDEDAQSPRPPTNTSTEVVVQPESDTHAPVYINYANYRDSIFEHEDTT